MILVTAALLVPVCESRGNKETASGWAQIDLGSFSLGRGPSGDLEMKFSQGAYVLGFGGDRSLQLVQGERGVGLSGGVFPVSL